MMQGSSSQVIRSPARLGLPTPSPSLSLSSSNPPKPHTTSPPPTTTAPPATHPQAAGAAVTGASSLLPLLPPLPRAQSLLQLLSSLASKVFDLSPNCPTLLAAYRGAFPTFPPSSSSSAAGASTPPSHTPSPSSTTELLAGFAALQSQLFDAVGELQEILDLQDARSRAVREAGASDATHLAFSRKLRDAHHVLDRLVEDYSAEYRKSGSAADPAEPFSLYSSLDLKDVLSYAHRISYTTFAPPEFAAGLAPLRCALPPAPQENEMRASILYQYADLDVGAPPRKKLKLSDATDRVSDASALIAPLLEPTPPREQPLPSVPVTMLPITVPSGWRPGMPVELPSELPLPPPGWKVGDPITLLPDGVPAVGHQIGERPRASAAQHKEPGIQVRQVVLDIGGDDYSSDYSSEANSSEMDDED